MGKKGKAIVNAKLEEVIEDLKKAYADEWLAHMQYWVTAQWIKGIDADTLRPLLLKGADDELKHAEMLAKRIILLGGKPPANPKEIMDNATCGYKEPPRDPTDLKTVVHNVLETEGCVIEYYAKMVDKYRSNDVVTHELLEELLEEEVNEEEEWEKILAKL